MMIRYRCKSFRVSTSDFLAQCSTLLLRPRDATHILLGKDVQETYFIRFKDFPKSFPKVNVVDGLMPIKVFHLEYHTHVRFTCGLYFIFIFQTVSISLKFGGIPLMLCGSFSREGYFRERLNLTRVR